MDYSASFIAKNAYISNGALQVAEVDGDEYVYRYPCGHVVRWNPQTNGWKFGRKLDKAVAVFRSMEGKRDCEADCLTKSLSDQLQHYQKQKPGSAIQVGIGNGVNGQYLLIVAVF